MSGLIKICCPYCIIICDLEHLEKCKNRDIKLLCKRMNYESNRHDKEIEENYLEFIKYDQSLFPFYWIFPQETNVKLLELPLNHPLIHQNKMLKDIVNNNLLKDNFVFEKIFLKQNKELYLKYHETNYVKGEEYYFHGSPNYENICLQGFDKGFSKNGSYGYGIYITKNIDTALHFNNTLLLCKVKLSKNSVSLINDYCTVLKDDFSIYPEFLIKFK
jgi:hypothetical protein